mgnify:CR=1 FL=1
MPEIFTASAFSQYLSDEVQSADRLPMRAEIAEARVVHRYREQAAAYDSEMFFDEPLTAEGNPGVVRLNGWEETEDGTPDVEAMDDDLVRRLRIVIAQVMEWRYEHEAREGVESKSQGSRSVSYDTSEPSLPTRLFQPLQKYDEREPFSGRW